MCSPDASVADVMFVSAILSPLGRVVLKLFLPKKRRHFVSKKKKKRPRRFGVSKQIMLGGTRGGGGGGGGCDKPLLDVLLFSGTPCGDTAQFLQFLVAVFGPKRLR